jgi:hypothetical protein
LSAKAAEYPLLLIVTVSPDSTPFRLALANETVADALPS